MNPMVGIVIVNWNKCHDLLRLLDSLRCLEYDNYDIFVVDNASTDNSVEQIEKYPLRINLLVNDENLGGTGGFNSGIKFALSIIPCKYIWLLDNDATVTPRALKELVDVMESDSEIGIAGSRIVNANNPDYIVETGAMLDWYSGVVSPVERNVLKCNSDIHDPIDVDYVAVCSAVVRVSSLVEVGLMDSRYFLFWDDMDWGCSFKNLGYKVVCVPNSEVYHPAFTEYRSITVDSYYGVRNKLLTFAKSIKNEGALIGLLNINRRVAKSLFLMNLTKKPGGILQLFGYLDFLRGKWGKITWDVSQYVNCTDSSELQLSSNTKVLVVANSDVNSTIKLVKYLNSEGIEKIDILIEKDRYELFTIFQCHKLVLVDYNNTFANIKTFVSIWSQGYNYSVKTATEKISPFTFAIKKSAFYDHYKNRLFSTSEGRAGLWKVFFSFFLGEFLGVAMFSLAFLRSIALIRRTY